MTATVRDAFAGYPRTQRSLLLAVRDLILAAAAEDGRIGPLTETLKWGEPASLTEATGSGSTLRLGLAKRDRAPAMFVNRRTSLVSEVRDRYGDAFSYGDIRVIVLPRNLRAQAQAVRHVAWLALTYHLRRRSR